MKKYNPEFYIGNQRISIEERPYFIADIAANHDGDIERAKDLIFLAKEAGADVAKFQHFKSNKIVSDFGFNSLENSKLSHQSTWKRSVAEIYDQYHTKREWNDTLIETCHEAEIEFMTTPYDIDAMDGLLESVNAIKIGSGDITYIDFLETIALLNKPMLLATGASDINDVINAFDVIVKYNQNVCLMQCNTNYTGDIDNFKYVNLNVLKSFSTMYPNLPLGFSDHTPGHSAVLGAITLGARVIEKHFTDDNNRVGPDHHFALNADTWRDMVDSSLELYSALGDGVKRIEENELDTVVIQRRAIRAAHDLAIGTVISHKDIESLRPCPIDALTPASLQSVISKKLTVEVKKGELITLDILL